MPWSTPNVSSPAMTISALAKRPAASLEQLAQVTRFREMQHCCNDDRGERWLGHISEQRGQKNQREEAEDCRDNIGDLAAGTCGRGHRSFRQTAHNKKSAEKPAEYVCWPVRNQLLVWITSPPLCKAAALAAPSASA